MKFMSHLLMQHMMLVVLFVSVSLKASQVTLVWDQEPTANGYRIYAAIGAGNFSHISNVSVPTVTLFADINQINRYYVTSWNFNGESQPSNIVVFTSTKPTTPNPPTDIWINDLNRRRRSVNWLSDVTAQTIIEQAIESGPFEQVAIVSAGITYWIDTRAKQKVTTYRLKSCKNSLCSSWSEKMYRPL